MGNPLESYGVPYIYTHALDGCTRRKGFAGAVGAILPVLRNRITDASLREVQAKRGKADRVAARGHEWRTPMQAIFGYIELLDREIHGPLSREQAHHPEQIPLTSNNWRNF